MWQPEFSTPNALPPDFSWAAWPLQTISAVIADQKFNIRLHRLTCTRFACILDAVVQDIGVAGKFGL